MSDYEDYIREKGFGYSGFSNVNTPENNLERKKALKLALEIIEKYHGKEKFEKLVAQLKAEIERTKQS